MTSKLTREERVQFLYGLKIGQVLNPIDIESIKMLARMALAAMDSSESVELPLDYLQGHKDGLEWAARLAEANHPATGDWLYDDPIELAKAIRKGPDMPPSQPALDTEPVAYTDERNLGYIDRGRETAYLWGKQNSEASDVALYRHAQPSIVPDAIPISRDIDAGYLSGWNDCRAAMLQENPVCTCPSGDGSLRWPCPVHPGNSPVVPDEVEHVAAVLELIGSFEAADIDSDTVDLRFEIDDVDTGSDASITEYAARGAAIIRMLAGNSPAIPDGYALVPKEARKEILDEFDSIIDYGAEDSVDAWHRVLAAATQEVSHD